MSYCRWSSDAFQCDLYCYESVHDVWVTHVAGRKNIERCPEIDYTSEETIKATLPAYNAWLRRDDREYRDITLPHAGETFQDSSLEEFKERLLYLRGLGYNFPDYVLENVEEEIRENNENEQQ